MPRWTGKALVAVVTIAGSLGAWQLLPASRPPSLAPNAVTLQSVSVPRLASVAVVPSPTEQPTPPAKVLPATATDTRAREATKHAPRTTPPSVTGEPTRAAAEQARPTRTAGSNELVTARATTWVNVRAEANSRSAIVGIILPDSIVELGEIRRSWRRVSTRWFSGWASAKLFTLSR